MAQCGNCHFENLPGQTNCGRCGSSMTLRTAVIDVHPPRAGAWAKRWRRFRFRQMTNVVRDGLGAVWEEFVSHPDPSVSQMAVAQRLIIPGWAQIYIGRSIIGFTLLSGYLVSLLLFIAYFGTENASRFLGIMLALHGATVYDLVFDGPHEMIDRLVRFARICAVLAVAVYLPAYLLVAQVGTPITLRQVIGPFAVGDVVLYRHYLPLFRPHAGDMAVYRIPDTSVIAQANRIYFLTGQRIDRVLAEPGQSVAWDGPHLSVDGVRSRWSPLNNVSVRRTWSGIVPPDRVLILPGDDAGAQVAMTDVQWQQVCLIPMTNVIGRVYWQQWPWSKMGFIR